MSLNKAPGWVSWTAGLIAGVLIGLLILSPRNRHVIHSAVGAPPSTLENVDQLSPEEIQALIMKALSKLGERQELTTGLGSDASPAPDGRTSERQDMRIVINNIRRLLPFAKRWTAETLRHTVEDYDIKKSDWPRIARMIDHVHRIVPGEDLQGVAAVRENRLSEILIDPVYAPDLTSDDDTIFVLSHELTHVAARSGKLNRFIAGVAEKATRSARVEPTKDQREDLACDFIGELVLKQFIALHPTSDSAAVRVSRVFGYESPTARFARAWKDFCASYNGDPGDDDHLPQYQTLRALLALDPELQSSIPLGPIPPPGSSAPSR